MAEPGTLTRPPTGYLPTLDGWRAVAILAVMLCHDRVHRIGPVSTQWLHEHGNLGVDVFFAISGLLICLRLLDEEEARGSVSLRSFYLRRAFRILPAASVYLIALFILGAFGKIPVEPPELLASLFFLRNYTSTFSHFQVSYPYYTSHFWSLAVEEHFYLLVPPLLFLPVLARRWRVPILLLLASAVGVHRMALNSWLSMHTDMRLDALLVPAAFAVLLRSPKYGEGLKKVAQLAPIFVILLLLLVTAGLYPRTTGLLLAWLTPFVLLATMLDPQRTLSRMLESRPLRYIGRISYSLYLWQQLFLVAHFGPGPGSLGVLQRWPFNWMAAFACALLSFYFVEQPLIRLGHRRAPDIKNHLSLRDSLVSKL